MESKEALLLIAIVAIFIWVAPAVHECGHLVTLWAAGYEGEIYVDANPFTSSSCTPEERFMFASTPIIFAVGISGGLASGVLFSAIYFLTRNPARNIPPCLAMYFAIFVVLMGLTEAFQRVFSLGDWVCVPLLVASIATAFVTFWPIRYQISGKGAPVAGHVTRHPRAASHFPLSRVSPPKIYISIPKHV